MNIEDIDRKLEQLRTHWKNGTGGDREILRKRARALEIAKELALRKRPLKLRHIYFENK